jgi:hypothetical protein
MQNIMLYDVAALVADLKEKDAQIARLAPNYFTELESRLAINAIREIHTPDRATHAMHKDAATAIQKLQKAAARRTYGIDHE